MATKKQTQVEQLSAAERKAPGSIERQTARVERIHPAVALQRVADGSRTVPRPSDTRALQRALGNRGTRRILQAKLTVTPAGDRYEQEADRVAAQVVSRMRAPVSQRQEVEDEEELMTKPLVQRQEVEDEDELMTKSLVQRQEVEDEDELMTKPLAQRQVDAAGGMDVDADVEAAVRGARGGGQPLADSVRGPMERAFGADLSGVRVHTGSQADALNRSIQARSFTTGRDIFFRQGAYAPGSRSGQELIAHELTHVVQQSPDLEIVQRMFGSFFDPFAALAEADEQDEGSEDTARDEFLSEVDDWGFEDITTQDFRDNHVVEPGEGLDKKGAQVAESRGVPISTSVLFTDSDKDNLVKEIQDKTKSFVQGQEPHSLQNQKTHDDGYLFVEYKRTKKGKYLLKDAGFGRIEYAAQGDQVYGGRKFTVNHLDGIADRQAS